MQKVTDNQIPSFSLPLARAIGYYLVILALFDIVDTVIPAYFMNPAWEFQTIGALVERVPVALLGIWLVFYGEQEDRKRWEKFVLKFLSWTCLIAGIVFLLLIPLGVNNVIRLHYQGQYQINTQVSQQNNRLQQLKSQLENATAEQMNNLVTLRNSQGSTPNIENPQDLQAVKHQLSEEIARAQERLNTQSMAARENQRLVLMKRSAKWLLGSLLAGILYIRIWYETRWARRSHKRRRV